MKFILALFAVIACVVLAVQGAPAVYRIGYGQPYGRGYFGGYDGYSRYLGDYEGYGMHQGPGFYGPGAGYYGPWLRGGDFVDFGPHAFLW